MRCLCTDHEHLDPGNYGRCAFELADGGACGCTNYTVYGTSILEPITKLQVQIMNLKKRTIPSALRIQELVSSGDITPKQGADLLAAARIVCKLYMSGNGEP